MPSKSLSSSGLSSGSPSGHVRVYVVDDHPAIQKAIQNEIEEVIDMEICGTSHSVQGALEEIKKKKPDVAIVDISLKGSPKGGHGFDLLQKLRDESPGVETIVYSMYDEEVYAERALRTGASGYLMKSEPIGHLTDAIRRVSDGKLYLSRRMYRRVLGGVVTGGTSEPKFQVDRLTDRERQVFEMLGEGRGMEEITERLGISRKTVETHRRRAKEKLGFDSITELLQHAVQWALAKQKSEGENESKLRES